VTGTSSTQPAQSSTAIRTHVERHIGPIDRVFRDESDAAIDVLHVAPVDSRPYHTLVTTGMSEFEMPVPADKDAPRRLELMMTLRERWRLEDQLSGPASGLWPVRLLQRLGRWTREHNSWLGWGHAVPNGEPAQPFAASTKLCGVILAPSLLVPVAFYELGVGNQRTAFYSAIPLYREELELHRQLGMEALLTKLLRYDINDVVEPARRNVAKRFFGLF
jgi:Suppressor of fused protein (SUFU)